MNDLKVELANKIAEQVKSGEVIAVGAGTTVQAAIAAIGQRVAREKLQVACVTSSLESAWYCEQVGLQVLAQSYQGELGWGFDGADAVDANLRAIKGRGGAMLQEKIIAERCQHLILLITANKLLANLAAELVPIEVIPIAYDQVCRELKRFSATNLILRVGSGKAGPVITEQGNIIIDAQFAEITADLEREIKSITGVVENGLFLSQAHEVFVADSQGIKHLTRL